MIWRFLAGVLGMLAFWQFWRGLRKAPPPPPGRGGSHAPPEARRMIRDPHCGTYIPVENALPGTGEASGEMFCSRECRDAFSTSPSRR